MAEPFFPLTALSEAQRAQAWDLCRHQSLSRLHRDVRCLSAFSVCRCGIWTTRHGKNRVRQVLRAVEPDQAFLARTLECLWYEDVAILATKRNALLVPMILRCEPEEVYRRVTSPERAVRFKETSADRTRENIHTFKLLRIDHPNCLELEITHLSPIQAAQAILTHVEIRESPSAKINSSVT